MENSILLWFHIQSGWLLSVTGKKSQSVILVHIPLKLVNCSYALQLFWCRISYFLFNQIVLFSSGSVQRADGTFVLHHKHVWPHPKEALGRAMVKDCCRWPSWVLPQEILKYRLPGLFSKDFVGITRRYLAGCMSRPRDRHSLFFLAASPLLGAKPTPFSRHSFQSSLNKKWWLC